MLICTTDECQVWCFINKMPLCFSVPRAGLSPSRMGSGINKPQTEVFVSFKSLSSVFANASEWCRSSDKKRKMCSVCVWEMGVCALIFNISTFGQWLLKHSAVPVVSTEDFFISTCLKLKLEQTASIGHRPGVTNVVAPQVSTRQQVDPERCWAVIDKCDCAKWIKSLEVECLNAASLVRWGMEIIIAAVSSCTSQHMIENFKSKLRQRDSRMPYVGLDISKVITLFLSFLGYSIWLLLNFLSLVKMQNFLLSTTNHVDICPNIWRLKLWHIIANSWL